MKRVEWNIGRKYSAAGQRIVAIQLDSGLLVFVDKDRMIDGVIRGGRRELEDWEIKERVMTAYDHNLYDYPREDEEYAAIRQANQKPQEPKTYRILCHHCGATYEHKGSKPIQCAYCGDTQLQGMND